MFLDGPSLAKRLRWLAERCDGLDVAMAYVKERGLETLLRGVNPMIKKGGHLRIVFGLAERLGITDWKAAERLLKLSNRHANIVVRKLNNGGFHPKLFIFHGSPSYLVVGSANLTGAAQSTNAEANLVVTGPSEKLMNDAQEFFDRNFAGAIDLKRAHVEAYKRRVKSNPLPAGLIGSRGDPLPPGPSPQPTNGKFAGGARVWKIAPGKDGKGWPDWERGIGEDGDGYVAMGWDEVGSLDDFQTYEELRRTVAEKAKKVWNKYGPTKTNEKYATDQLWAFRNEPTAGDVFIVYSQSRVFGIAEVTAESEYRYRPDLPWGGHQITVRYRVHFRKPDPADKRIIETLGRQGTLLQIKEPNFLKYLVRTLP
jgi:HKD family nuclease